MMRPTSPAAPATIRRTGPLDSTTSLKLNEGLPWMLNPEIDPEAVVVVVVVPDPDAVVVVVPPPPDEAVVVVVTRVQLPVEPHDVMT